MFDVNPNIGARFDSMPITEGGERQDRDIRELLAARDAFTLNEARAVTILNQVELATRGRHDVGHTLGEQSEAADRFARALEEENRAWVHDLAAPAEESMPRRKAGGTFASKEL